MAAHRKKLLSIFPKTGNVSEPGYSYDQKIGMLRKLFTGQDPYRKDREKVADEFERLFRSSVQFPVRDSVDEEIDYLVQTDLYLKPQELRYPSPELIKRGVEDDVFGTSKFIKEFIENANPVRQKEKE